MDKFKLTGRVQEFHVRQVTQSGYEEITLVVHYTYENGTYKRDFSTPVKLSSKLPAGLEKFDALKVGVGDMIEIPFLPGGYKSKNGEFWNAKLEGDLFGLKVVEKAIEFGEKAPGDY